MLVKTYGCAIQGISGTIISVECSVSAKGNHQILLGLAGNEVKEGMPRVASAIKSSNCYFPDTKMVMSLAPSDIKKTSASFDLPMAIAVLGASSQLPDLNMLNDYIFLGELSLTGELLKIKGALPSAIKAWEEGFKGIIVPEENAVQAAIVTKLTVYGVKRLYDVIDFLRGNKKLEPTIVDTRKAFYESQHDFSIDFTDVKGQELLKKSLETAAAGNHNLIVCGPPGSGYEKCLVMGT